jgi:hypothetical protein
MNSQALHQASEAVDKSSSRGRPLYQALVSQGLDQEPEPTYCLEQNSFCVEKYCKANDQKIRRLLVVDPDAPNQDLNGHRIPSAVLRQSDHYWMTKENQDTIYSALLSGSIVKGKRTLFITGSLMRGKSRREIVHFRPGQRDHTRMANLVLKKGLDNIPAVIVISIQLFPSNF